MNGTNCAQLPSQALGHLIAVASGGHVGEGRANHIRQVQELLLDITATHNIDAPQIGPPLHMP